MVSMVFTTIVHLGSNGGLLVATQFKLSDWTAGPHFYGEGFRIAIHEPGTVVHNLYDNGISMRPGMTTEVAMTQKQEAYLVRFHDSGEQWL